MERKQYEFNGVQVIQDKDIRDPDSFDARRPYYRIRGPRVTEDQAFEIIRKTDRVFRISLEDEKYRKLGHIDTMNFGQVWFNKNYVPSPRGWSHPNGIIGENGITGKYPEMDEYLWELTNYVKAFPFLNMIIAVTDWDEMPDYAWDLHWSDPIRLNHDYKDFIDSIEIAFLLHNGVLEILNKERSQQVYKEYIAKYEEMDPMVYLNDYYSDRNLIPANYEYLCRLIAAYGLDPKEELKDFPWKNWLEGKPENPPKSDDTEGSGLEVIVL